MFNFKIYFMSEQTPLSLGTEDIKKLLMRYAFPAMVAMTAATLYNMMDSIFIGHGVGALGIAGLAVTFPFINLAAAFGSLVGVGASTLVTAVMGQTDLKSAEAVLGNVLLLNTVMGFLFMTVWLIFPIPKKPTPLARSVPTIVNEPLSVFPPAIHG